MDKLTRATNNIVESGMTAVQMSAGQFVTAMKVQQPRMKSEVLARVNEEAEIIADDFYYCWEVNSKGEKNIVEGISIKGAMAVAREYGNCATYAETVSEGASHWEFRGIFLDLETGFTSIRSFRQRKSTGSRGKYDQGRLEDINFQIGQSKAIRNAILNGVPQWLLSRALEKAKESTANKLTSGGLEGGKQRCIDIFSRKGVKKMALENKLRKGFPEWGKDDLVTLKGILNAIEQGQTTISAEFPRDENPSEIVIPRIISTFAKWGVTQVDLEYYIGISMEPPEPPIEIDSWSEHDLERLRIAAEEIISSEDKLAMAAKIFGFGDKKKK